MFDTCRTDQAATLGFERSQISGAGFVHTVFARPAAVAASSASSAEPLFVYLEGDGRPWNDRGTAARENPDPVRPLALELAATQQGAVRVLERPCYYGHSADSGCEAALWTAQRYSETVVASMAAALQQLALHDKAQTIVLIGYSGGGSLALLVADRVAAVKAVITVAANLDTAAWTQHHGYLPLSGSLDPLAARAHTPGCEIHIAAELDTVVPLAQTRLCVASRPGALLWIEPDADHACCWKERWPDLMRRIRQQLDAAQCLPGPGD